MVPIVLSPTVKFKLEVPREEVRLPETKAEFGAILDRAKAGNADAQYLAACTYRAQGDAMALYFLGKCCEEGTGTERNPTLAVAFYRRSAELDDPWAQCALGRCYERGIGTEKDIDKAREYYALAAETGDEEALEALGRLS